MKIHLAAFAFTCSLFQTSYVFAAQAPLPKLTPAQKQLALQTWQSQNLSIAIADALAQEMKMPPANLDNELGQRYGAMTKILSAAIEAQHCEIKNVSTGDDDGWPYDVHQISGAQCPVSYSMSANKKDGLVTSLKVNLPEYKELNDAVGSELSLVDQKGQGFFISKSLGKIPYSVINVTGNNEVTSIQTVEFPGFTAQVSATTNIGSSAETSDGEYTLNGERLSQDEVDTFFHLYPAFDLRSQSSPSP